MRAFFRASDKNYEPINPKVTIFLPFLWVCSLPRDSMSLSAPPELATKDRETREIEFEDHPVMANDDATVEG